MISCYNEWGSLREIVVGSATAANWPLSDSVWSQESQFTAWHQSPVPRGPVPQWIVDQANLELDQLSELLQSHRIRVHRPAYRNFVEHDGFSTYCPRDRLLIYGQTVIDPAMLYPCRDQEIDCYQTVLQETTDIRHMPRNAGMVLDAANVLKFDNRMLFLLSRSGNAKACTWLQQQFPQVKIETCEFYSGVHIDSTIMPLRNGLVLLNASRVRFDTVPRMFDGWQKIWITDVVEKSFYQYPYASKWIGMNLLVIDHQTCVVDQEQTQLIQTLRSYKFDVIPMPLTHSRTLGGGFHCATLDLVRE